MTYPLSKIEGISVAAMAALKKQGIRTTDKLLERAGSAKGRKDLAKETKIISEKDLLDWVNIANYMRIPGMGAARANLMRAAGVPTVREFIYRNADRLALSVAEANATHKLVRTLPSKETLTGLMAKGKKLDSKVTY